MTKHLDFPGGSLDITHFRQGIPRTTYQRPKAADNLLRVWGVVCGALRDHALNLRDGDVRVTWTSTGGWEIQFYVRYRQQAEWLGTLRTWGGNEYFVEGWETLSEDVSLLRAIRLARAELQP